MRIFSMLLARMLSMRSVRYEGHVLYPIDPLKTKHDISMQLIIPVSFVPGNVEVGP